MRSVLCVVVLLTLTSALFAVEMAPYFPIATGYWWDYQDSSEAGYRNSTSEVVGTTMMDGYETFVVENTYDDESADTSYYQVRPDGYYFYLDVGAADVGLDFGLIGVKMFPSDISVGEEWTAFQVDTALEIMGFPVDVQMDVTNEFVGYSDVETPMGDFFDCIHIVSTNVWAVDAGIFSDTGTNVMSISYYGFQVGITRETVFDLTSIFMGGGEPAGETSLLTDYNLTDIEEIAPHKPGNYSISAYPNPFNAQCLIEAPVGAKIEIFDLQGRLIESFNESPVTWQPDKNTASNIFLIRTTSKDDIVSTRKIIYLR